MRKDPKRLEPPEPPGTGSGHEHPGDTAGRPAPARGGDLGPRPPLPGPVEGGLSRLGFQDIGTFFQRMAVLQAAA